MKKCQIFLIIMLIVNEIGAQDPQTNIDKYWHYRYRLTHYFLLGIGPNRGESEPAAQRNFNDATYDSQGMSWDDSPISLGHYIGVLSTEYTLLKLYGQNTDETAWELYYALLTVYRLDREGYQLYGKNPNPFPGSGFIQASDIDNSLYSTYSNWINSSLTNEFPDSTLNYGSGSVRYVGTLYGDGLDPSNPAPASQDQCYGLLVGLSLAATLVDNVSQFRDPQGNLIISQYGGLRSMAIAEGTAICNYIANPPALIALLSGGFWLSKPDGSELSIGQGGDAQTYEVPISNLANNIFNDLNVSPNGGPFYCVVHPVECTSASLWSVIANCPTYNAEQDDIMAVELAAIGNAYAGITKPLDVIAFLGSSAPQCSQTYGWFGRDIFYRAICDVLYSNNPSNSIDMATFPFCTVQDMLNSAPWHGPFNHQFLQNGPIKFPNDYAGYGFSQDGQPGYGWASSGRFNANSGNPIAEPISGGNVTFNGNFNGLDYMLLFNLYYLMNYYLQNPQTIQPSYPALTQYIPGFAPPYSPAFIGTQCTDVAIQNLDIHNANTSPDAQAGGLAVAVGSGSSIIMDPQPGEVIHIEQGGYFHGYVTNLACEPTCEPVNYYYSYQPDPDPNGTNGKDHKSHKTGDSNNTNLPPYIKTEEFDTAFAGNSLMNYPNPFNSQTTIDFTLKNDGVISIYITDMSGKRIVSLVSNEKYTKGGHAINYNGSSLAQGTYMCVLISGTFRKTIKIAKTK